MEDELAKLSQQSQEKGEVLGPIVEVGELYIFIIPYTRYRF